MGSATGRISATGRVATSGRVSATGKVTASSRRGGMCDYIGNGLQAYYRNDIETITLTAAGKVSEWADISGNAKHAIQASPTRQPTITTNWSGRLSAVTFASGQVLGIASQIQTAKFPLTMGGVFQSTNNSGGRSIFCPTGSGGGHYLAIRSGGTSVREINVNQVGANQDGAATTNIEVWIASSEVFVSNPLLGVQKLFTGVTKVAQTLSPNTTTIFAPSGGVAFIGAITSGALQAFVGGRIGELFFMNRLMSTDEITRYLAYVQARYGTI